MNFTLPKITIKKKERNNKCCHEHKKFGTHDNSPKTYKIMLTIDKQHRYSSNILKTKTNISSSVYISTDKLKPQS